MMPYPAVLYAPNKKTLLRFGASPSAANWSVRPGDDRVFLALGNWDVGVTAERRVAGNVWFSVQAGVSGLRTLRISGDDFEAPEVELGSSPYFRIGINFRPSLN
jgi:hypothetical protein